MRGARGDAARRAEAAQATTSQSAFGDYVKFDDMFGASCIFTAGDPAQVQRQREAYVKETMARKLYGYVHRLETHGAPIQRVVVGGGCEAAENRGGFPTSRPRDETAGAHGADALGGDDPLASRKRARVGASAGGRAVGVSPAPRGGAAPQWGARAFEGPNARVGNEGSLANLFEQSLGEDWEHDPFWASMDSLATPGTVGGVGGPLEDPNALLPGALSRGAATEEDLMRRARIELIEERLHSLEHALASERVPKRSDKSGGAGGSGGSDKSNAFVRSGGGSGGDAAGRFADGPRDFVPASGLGVPGKESDEGLPSRSPATNLFQSGLFVETRPRDTKRGSSGASDKSGSGGSGKSPQSPSPLHRAPPDPSRSRSQSDERETLARRWNETETEKRHERTLAVSNGCAPSAEFPELVPDEGAELAGLGGGFASGFGGVQDARMMLLEHAAATRDRDRDRDPDWDRDPDAAVHKVSTSFTSTPGGGARGGGSGGESPRSAARRLAKENAALAEERRRAKQERDVLLAEHEHNKAQAALLQESNARYERRVAQLEALVRENALGAFSDAKKTRREELDEAFVSTRRDESTEKADAPSEKTSSEKTSSGVEGVMSGD